MSEVIILESYGADDLAEKINTHVQQGAWVVKFYTVTALHFASEDDPSLGTFEYRYSALLQHDVPE